MCLLLCHHLSRPTARRSTLTASTFFLLLVDYTVCTTTSKNEAEIESRLWSQKGTPAVLLLAGTGEHGYSRRLENLALPLARKGVVSVILESPFYGKRKPGGQVGSKLNKVSDLGLLGRITIEEASALVKFLKVNIGCGAVAVGGVSMGGLHAAMVASLLPFPVGVVSWLVSCACVSNKLCWLCTTYD